MSNSYESWLDDQPGESYSEKIMRELKEEREALKRQKEEEEEKLVDRILKRVLTKLEEGE